MNKPHHDFDVSVAATREDRLRFVVCGCRSREVDADRSAPLRRRCSANLPQSLSATRAKTAPRATADEFKRWMIVFFVTPMIFRPPFDLPRKQFGRSPRGPCENVRQVAVAPS